MLKSMTAYSRFVLVSPAGRFVVELQSVNRKHLEIHTHLPKSLCSFDGDIKKWVAHAVKRGQVNIRLNVVFEQQNATVVRPNLVLAAQVKDAWEQIALHLKIPASWVSAELLAKEEGMLIYEDCVHDEEIVKEALQQVFSHGISHLMAMKEKEGEALYHDIVQRLDKLQKSVDKIQQKSPGTVKKFRERLMLKLKEVVSSLSFPEDDDRLLKEVCLFADKVDIAEEITRFNSHLHQFREVLEGKEEAVGKTLEFILQELHREANTMGSKAADIELTRLVIEIKSELERIREQIQNVE